MNNLIEEGRTIWVRLEDGFHQAIVKRIDRVRNQVTVAYNIDELKNKKLEEHIDFSKVFEANPQNIRTYSLVSLNVVNEPELVDYFKWVLSTDHRYFELNDNLFFLNTSQKIHCKLEKDKFQKIMNKGKNRSPIDPPSYQDFIADLLFQLKNREEIIQLFLVGSKESAKSVHFNFMWEYLKEIFLNQNLQMQQKVEDAILVFQSLIYCFTIDGKRESFSFSTYDFCFNEQFEFNKIEFELVVIFQTFIAEQKSLIGLPVIFWVAINYFEKKNINLDYLKDFCTVTEDWEHRMKIQGQVERILKSMSDIGLDENFIETICLMLILCIDLINMKCVKSLSKLKRQ